MQRPLALAAVTILALPLGACGGKILDDRADGRGSANGTTSSSSGFGDPPPGFAQDPSPASPSRPPEGLSQGTKSSVVDVCGTICERNGRCGAGGEADCNRQCADDINASSACSPEVKAFIHCYADNLEGCASIPPVCENAYCAYTRCVGRVVPSYCH